MQSGGDDTKSTMYVPAGTAARTTKPVEIVPARGQGPSRTLTWLPGHLPRPPLDCESPIHLT
jgi:hypothetical protein